MAERKTAAAKTEQSARKSSKTAAKSVKKPVVAKTVSKASKTRTGSGLTGTARSGSGAKKPAVALVSAQQREAMIRDAAYFRAERRGFVGGDPCRDWLEAEEEIDRALGTISGS